MQRRLDQWTTALCALLILGALLACKKKTPETTAPGAESAAAPVATPPAPATTAAAAPTPTAEEAGAKLGDVKRYPDKEKPQTGAVKILENGVKVFNEADDKTTDVATLDKDLLVFRLASIPDWELVEFPSGVGKVSPGWVLAKFLDAKADAKVERQAVASQAKQAVVSTPKPASSAKAAASSSAKPTTAAAKAAADKAAADKAAADKAAAEAKAAADKATAEARAAVRKARAAAAAAAAAAGGTAPK
ncbi:MAG TPA: hypothetical protein VJN18_17260 [Polyangiaceae bacterium]|nr:hypothetical protein [Polyangiaceae bacterium]